MMKKILYVPVHKATGKVKWTLMHPEKGKVRFELKRSLVWSNCFDEYFYPTEQEIDNDWKFVKVKATFELGNKNGLVGKKQK